MTVKNQQTSKKINLKLIFPLLLIIIVIILGTLLVKFIPNTIIVHSPSSKKEQVFSIAFESEPKTLNPILAHSMHTFGLLGMLYEGLISTNINRQPCYGLAQDIEISPDLKEYIFKLKITRWSDGSLVTAGDFEYAWKQRLKPEVPQACAENLFIIKGAKEAKLRRISLDDVEIKVLDDHTLKICLEHPTPPSILFQHLRTVPFFPIPKDSIFPNLSTYPESKVITNGPFIIEDWKHDQWISLKKNENYWDKNNVKLDKVFIMFLKDLEASLALFHSGQIDWIGEPLSSFPIQAKPLLKRNDELQIYTSGACYYYLLNTRSPILKHQKIRQALSQSIDRNTIVQRITQSGEVATKNILIKNKDNKTKNSEQTNNKDTLKLFNEGIQESGLDINNLPPLRILLNPNELHIKTARFIAHEWETKLGLDVELQIEHFSKIFDYIHDKNFDVARLGFGSYDKILMLKHFDDSIDCRSGWHNAHYCQLIEQALECTDEDLKNNLIAEAEQLLIEQSPIIPLYFYTFGYLQSKRVKNFIISEGGMVYIKHVELDLSLE